MNMNTINIIDKYLEDQDLWKESTKVMSSHHPSAVNNCMRQLWYKWKAVKKRPDGTTELMIPVTDPRKAKDLWRMSMGTWIHSGYAELMVKVGFDVENEVEITHKDDRLKYPIHGYIDNVYNIDGQPSGIEVKSTFGYGSKALQISGEPKENDRDQVRVYMSTRRDIQQFNMPYIARDSFYRTEFEVFMTDKERDEFMDGLVKKLMKLELYVATSSLPDRDFQVCIKDGEIKHSIQHNGIKYQSNWQCEYCIRRSLCWKEELESFQIVLPDNGSEVKSSKKNNVKEDDLECIVE